MGDDDDIKGDSPSAPPTIEDRIALGIERGIVTDQEIIPFPDNWDKDKNGEDRLTSALGVYLRNGPKKAEIFARLNSGWTPRTHKYDVGGSAIFNLLRLDHPTEGKKVYPLRVEKMWKSGVPEFVCRHLASPRPLFNLDEIAERPDAPVLLVEGEKAAEAGQAMLPGFVVTTWIGGAGGVGAADLRVLRGRDVTIWPDNDPPGQRAAATLAGLLIGAGAASVRVVEVPAGFPENWDIAEPWPVESDHAE